MVRSVGSAVGRFISCEDAVRNAQSGSSVDAERLVEPVRERLASDNPKVECFRQSQVVVSFGGVFFETLPIIVSSFYSASCFPMTHPVPLAASSAVGGCHSMTKRILAALD